MPTNISDTAPLVVEYTCPGDDHPISRSVHLSRLASFYPPCRDCPHCEDTGELAQQTVERLQSTRRRVARPTHFTDEGIRAVHRNELTRADAGHLAGALAWLLWQQRPPSVPTTGTPTSTPARGPIVVVGHDARPSAPDLVVGVLAQLVRSGCRAIEIGRVSRPCFTFAVDHLQATAGIYVTGAGCDVAWTGLDAVTSAARPLSRGAGLEQWESRANSGYQRPTRRGGSRRSFDISELYEATLRRHFQPARPLKVCLGAAPGPLAATLTRLFEPLPWSLDLLACSTPEAGKRIARRVRDTGAEIGLICRDDDGHVDVIDESGCAIPNDAIATLLTTLILAEHPGSTIVVDRESPRTLDTLTRRLGGIPRRVPGISRAEIWQAMVDHRAVLGLTGQGNFWFREATPTCDAVLVGARLLQALDRHEGPLSQLLQRSV